MGLDVRVGSTDSRLILSVTDDQDLGLKQLSTVKALSRPKQQRNVELR